MVDDDRPRYAHWFRCRTCAHRFSVVRLTADSTKVKTPKCPHKGCNGRVRESHMEDRGMDVAAGRAPATTSVQATAYDRALQMTMEDQKETDIRDNARPGENSAPKLPAHLQPLADNFWSGPRKQKARTGRADLTPYFWVQSDGSAGRATSYRHTLHRRQGRWHPTDPDRETTRHVADSRTPSSGIVQPRPALDQPLIARPSCSVVAMWRENPVQSQGSRPVGGDQDQGMHILAGRAGAAGPRLPQSVPDRIRGRHPPNLPPHPGHDPGSCWRSSSPPPTSASP